MHKSARFEIDGGQQFQAVFTDANHAHVTNWENSTYDGREPFDCPTVIRGVPHHLSVHMYRQTDGTWTLNRSGEEAHQGWEQMRALYLNRSDKFAHRATDAAKNYVLQRIIPKVALALETFEDVRADAEIEAAKAAFESATAKVEAATAALEAALEERKAAFRRFNRASAQVNA